MHLRSIDTIFSLMDKQLVIFILFVSLWRVQCFIFSKECGSDTCTSSETCVDISSSKKCINDNDLDQCGGLSVCLLPTTCCNTFYCCPEGYMCADGDNASPWDCVKGVRSTTQRPSTTARPTYRSTTPKTWPTKRPTTTSSRGRSNDHSSSSSSYNAKWYYFVIPIGAVILIGVIIAIVCNVRKSKGQQGQVVQSHGNQAVYYSQKGATIQGTRGQTNPAYSTGPSPVMSKQIPAGIAELLDSNFEGNGAFCEASNKLCTYAHNGIQFL